MPNTLPITAKLDPDFIDQLQHAFSKIDGFGSIEIYIQRNRVTQITTRNIVKTDKPVDRLTNHKTN